MSFKQEIIKDQIQNNLKLSENISKHTKMCQSPDNILTRVDDRRPLMKNTLKATKEDIIAENRRIKNVANPKNGEDAVN